MNQMDSIFQDAVAAGVAPGLVAMVGSGQDLIHTSAVGRLAADTDAPMGSDAIFWIASLTKLITSIAALQLVDRRMLALDQPLHRLLPELADLQVLQGFAPNGEPLLRTAARPMTLRHLLAHTSGFGYDWSNADLLRARGAAPPAPTTLAALNSPLLFDPGEGWIYGISTDWVGRAVEAASGQALDRYFATEIFEPLGMGDTGFAIHFGSGDRRARHHQRQEDGSFTPIPTPVDDLSAWEFFSGGAGLFSTAGDYMRLLQMLLRQDGRILSKESAQALFKLETGKVRAGTIASLIPSLNAPFDLFPDMHTGWSLGGMVNPAAVPGGRCARSLSWAGIANTYYWADPTSDRCAVLMAQFLPFADPPMIELVRTFEKAVYSDL